MIKLMICLSQIVTVEILLSPDSNHARFKFKCHKGTRVPDVKNVSCLFWVRLQEHITRLYKIELVRVAGCEVIKVVNVNSVRSHHSQYL